MNRSYVTRWVCWVALCFMLASGGCSSGSPTGSGAGGGTGGGAGGGGVTFTMTTNVEVGNNFFSPQNIQVSPRATVTWTWMATAGTHNVTFATGSGLNIGNQTGGSHSATMPAALDDYSYQCTIHSGMTGTVRVR